VERLIALGGRGEVGLGKLGLCVAPMPFNDHQGKEGFYLSAHLDEFAYVAVSDGGSSQQVSFKGSRG
jgi:hypothetical protein